jgi:hypothetical protein
MAFVLSKEQQKIKAWAAEFADRVVRGCGRGEHSL